MVYTDTEDIAQNDLEPCPKCNEEIMRPTGKVGTDGGIDEPFTERGVARRYQCDNEKCGHVQFNASMTENVKLEIV